MFSLYHTNKFLISFKFEVRNSFLSKKIDNGKKFLTKMVINFSELRNVSEFITSLEPNSRNCNWGERVADLTTGRFYYFQYGCTNLEDWQNSNKFVVFKYRTIVFPYKFAVFDITRYTD